MLKYLLTTSVVGCKFNYAYVISDQPRVLATYVFMAAQLQKDFPGLTSAEIKCGVITSSPHWQGFPVVYASVRRNCRPRVGYKNVTGGLPDGSVVT